MKKILVLFLFLFFSVSVFGGFVPYYYFDDFLYSSPGTYRYGLLGYINPANLADIGQPELLLNWVDNSDKYGLFTALPNFGFGMIYNRSGDYTVRDYRLSTGFGNRQISVGFGLGWSSGDKDAFKRDNVYTMGMLYRPSNMISLGLSSSLSRNRDRDVVFDIGFRPLKTDKLTLFGDIMYSKIDGEKDDRWSMGISAEPFSGIKLTGRYMSDEHFTLGMQVSFGRAGIGGMANFSDESEHINNTYSLRLGGYERCIRSNFQDQSQYISLDMHGEVSHRKFAMFDSRKTLFDLINLIEKAKNDDAVAGIAINTSGLKINNQMIWEIREKLIELRNAGKKVIIYIDRADISVYHFASAADRIVMDPWGMISLEGYASGNTYYKNMLAKLGIGFRELRYFIYKSAAEAISRDSMSEYDREQRQRMIDLFYETAREDITKSRGIDTEKFDELVNEIRLFDSAKALEKGLIDATGRFDKAVDYLRDNYGKGSSMLKSSSFEMRQEIDYSWGSRPVIAVVYALGGTDMDTGIRARDLHRIIRSLKKNKRVEAIILRVDSPGGDGLASDLVAEAVRECRGIKPVIISQGHVAASGGYWISMDGDVIVSSPVTITGSIGVIGGWLYNDGFSEKIGLDFDIVKRGASADLGRGIMLPLLNISLPDRDLNEKEQKIAEEYIRSAYDGFVKLVADARGKTFEEIEEVAQGRIWIGRDALERGLVDEIGGLDRAVEIALAKIGRERSDVEIQEFPRMGLLNLQDIIKFSLFGIQPAVKADPFVEDILLRLRFNGIPIPVMSVEYYDFVELSY